MAVARDQFVIHGEIQYNACVLKGPRNSIFIPKIDLNSIGMLM